MQIPKFVSYKDLMLVFGISERAAKHKLSYVRMFLKKERRQVVLNIEFCHVENIALPIYEEALRIELIKLISPKLVKK